MKLTKQQRDAVKLYRNFREREPKRVATIDIDLPDMVAVMGHVEFIGYKTTHGRKSVMYKHQFAKGSRPLLAAGPDIGQAFLIGDRFHVTERGIVDLDADGNEIDDGGGRRL